jgi:hypothetical protein
MPIPVELPLTKHFSDERIKEIDVYCRDRLKSIVQGQREIREVKIEKWRKVWSGEPREKSKSFPWQGASNLVIQLVGSYESQLTAKIVMATIAADPLWVAGLLGEFGREEHAEEQRQAVESWLAYSGLEPDHLNLLDKYVVWIRTMVKYGLGAMKLLPEISVEQVAQTIAANGSITFKERTRHDGPVALPLLFEDFLIPATHRELERYPIVAQRSIMQRYEIEPLLYDETFDKKAVEKVLAAPDRQGPDSVRRDIEQSTGAKSDYGGPLSDEWDFYESYFPFTVLGKRFHIIETYHLQSETPLKRVFNWLPENSLPFVAARLGSDGERSHGFGFCEMLKDYQEEVSAIHNRRGDASTLSNTNLIRAGEGTQLDSNFSIYPNALVTGAEGTIEVIPLGRNANETIKDEQQTLNLATDRAGVGPAASGAGAGAPGKKGQYSAMGAFPILQEGNTRANLNVTEFRTSHYILGRKKLLYDSHFGISKENMAALGKQAKYLEMALKNYRERRINLPIRAATGSVNKEIEKQNLMLLLNNVRAHGQQISQLLQAISNPMAPPEMQHFLASFAMSSTFLMKRICREFGIEDPSSVVPDVMGLEERIAGIEKQIAAQKQQQQQQGAQPQPGAPPQPGQQPQLPAPAPTNGGPPR